MSTDARPPADTLAALRSRIDEVDSRLLSAVAERAQIAKLVGEAKLAAGSDPGSDVGSDPGGEPVHRPAREASLIRSLIDRYEGPMDRRAIHAVWRELIGASTAIQKPLTIATADTTAEMTARLHFGASHGYFWAASPVAAVPSGDADIALFDVSDISNWQAAADLIDEREDCELLWRLPFTISAGGWVAVGRGIIGDSGLDQTVVYSDDASLAGLPAVETICASPDGGAVLAVAGVFDEDMLPAALGVETPVQRLGQWPAPLEIRSNAPNPEVSLEPAR